MTQRILIADDEPLYLRTTGELLRNHGYDCVCVPDATVASERLCNEEFDLVLSDLNMPGNLKLELLHDHSRHRRHIPLIVITGVPSLPSAIESIRLGITDYLLKPVKFETLLQSVRKALQNTERMRAAVEVPARPASELQRMFPTIVGTSPAILEILEIIDRIAATDTNILITGESGTGKEVVAKAIHEHSARAGGAFQVIDCTAIPETLFESMLFGHKKGSFTGAVNDQAGLLKQCDGGTAFFDEVGELPLAMQSKLLRVVQEQTFIPVGCHQTVSVNTRFICATNRNLQMEVAAGRFRQDLFYRLGVIHVELPPLRERGEDVILLADKFIKMLDDRRPSPIGFAEQTLKLLREYHWPGNIRELRNAIERSFVLRRGDLIEPSDLPETLRTDRCRSVPHAHLLTTPAAEESPVPALPVASQQNLSCSRTDALKAAEHQYLMDLMRTHQGNVSAAARHAALSRQGLHKLLKTYGINPVSFRT